jgi:ankyrin repeat protein
MIPRNYIRTVAYLLLISYVSFATAGSYEDFFAAIRRNEGSTVAALLERGFDPNTRDPSGQTGLTLAMLARSFEAARPLMEHSATDVNGLNQAGESALMLAALKGDLASTRRLLERGAKVNLPGWSALHYAASGPEASVAALLLDHGADINAESPNRTTPLMMAARYGSEACVSLLLARGADVRRRNELSLGAADFAALAGRDALARQLAGLAR